jgi:hypothetical protein
MPVVHRNGEEETPLLCIKEAVKHAITGSVEEGTEDVVPIPDTSDHHNDNGADR